jgi:hypothetical protein
MAKLVNVQHWYRKRHIATLHWQKPYALAKSLKRIEEIDKKYPKGTYFKLV